MKHLQFSNGDQIPALGLGTWQSKPNEVFNAVMNAIEIGYRHFDCAYIYENEKEIGAAIKQAMADKLVTREELFITSKLWNADHDPSRVERAIHKSLHDLNLDYLDLYLIHWPIAFKPGVKFSNKVDDLVSLNEIPLSSTWEAMIQLKDNKLTKHIGVSNFNIPKMKTLKNETGIFPEMNQVEMHPFFQQENLLKFATENNILSTAYSPLGSRHLINTPDSVTQSEIIRQLAAKYNCESSQIILAWGMKRGTAVIPKSTNKQRIAENFASINIELNNADMQLISTLEKGQRMSKGAYAVMDGGCYTSDSIWKH